MDDQFKRFFKAYQNVHGLCNQSRRRSGRAIQEVVDHFGDPPFNALRPFDLAKMIELDESGMPASLTQDDAGWF